MNPARLFVALLALAACHAEGPDASGPAGISGGPGGTAGTLGAGNGGGGAGNGGAHVDSFDKLDLLLVLDNSSSTSHLQLNLACNFSRFVDGLRALTTGMPDLHIAVVTPDLGAGALRIPSCARPGGDDGAMQSAAYPVQIDCSANGPPITLDTTGCTGPQGGKAWIRYRSPTDNNIGGQALTRAVACISALGDQGCGFESPLAAAARALERASDENDPSNGGFLRVDALLLIVILTDEDDCSLPADSLLGDTTGTDLDSDLGPLTSFRCTEHGVICDGFQRDPAHPAAIRQPGPMGGYRNCRPNDDGVGVPDPRHRLVPVRDLVARIQAIKPPWMTKVEVIGGPAPPDAAFDVEQSTVGGTPAPRLTASCRGSAGVGLAEPGVRLQAFLEAWDGTRRVIPVCQPSFAEVLAGIARRLGGGP